MATNNLTIEGFSALYLKHVVVDQSLWGDGNVNFADLSRNLVAFCLAGHEVSDEEVKLLVTIAITRGSQ